jgi:acyl-CoA synthetase (NDP forming)
MMSFYGLFADRCTGMNRLISTGNQVDVTLSEALMNLVEDEGSDVIAAFLEGLSDGRFVAAARRA